MEENRRPVKEKKKKLRKGRLLLFLLVLVIIAAGIYGYTQYQSGLKLAGENKPEEELFIADEDEETIENYLIIGVDTRGEENSRSDTMMLLSWNHETDEMKLVSFMRDIYAEIPGYRNYKLNTAYYLGGVQLLKETLGSMFDVSFQHYALIDFQNFESLIDVLAPNGIKMDVEKDMSENIDVELKAGTHKLNGKELLGYARFRHDEEGDFGRVERQQKVVEALKDQLISVGTVKNLPKLVGATQGYITTDISNKQQLKKVLEVVAGGGVTIDKMTIPAEGTYKDASYSHAGWVLEIDVEQNKQILQDFLNN